MDVDEVTGVIVDTAIQIHRGLGPGLLESVYSIALASMLQQRGLIVVREKMVTFEFNGLTFDEGFRVDLLVDNQVVVEVKSVEKLAPVHAKQCITYLRLLDLRVGLVINFGAPTLLQGLCRVVNRYQPPSTRRT